ncbi:MAG: ADOP family duplicated permease [Myxococcales bacterium]
MWPFRPLARGLRMLGRRRAADRDLADEVEQYLDAATDAFVAQGLPPEEARRRARIEIGNETALREEVRSYGWENVALETCADVRQGLRLLRKSPGFTAVTVLTLALGIGSSTAIFSAVDPILFAPLPYPGADRIVAIAPRQNDGTTAQRLAFGNVREIRERAHAFEALAAARPWQPSLSGSAEPERLEGQRASAGYFRVFGVAPALGQQFDAAEDRPDGATQVILGDRLFRRRFGGDPSLVGRTILLDEVPFTVVGVMPASFEDVLAPSAQVWTLLQYDPAQLGDVSTREWGNHLRLVARVRADVPLDRAAEELDGIAGKPLGEFPRPPWASLQRGFVVRSLQDDLTEGVKPALLAVLGAVLLLLLIACVNATNLLLARGARRRGEFALRAALGASRPRVVRQLLTETLLLASLGGGLGVLLAVYGVQALVAIGPSELPRLSRIHVDARALVFAVTVSVLAGLLFGAIPAFHGSRGDLRTALQQVPGRSGHQTTRRALVVAEVALALVLLVGAGLLLRSLKRLFAVDPGFDPAGVLTLTVQTTGQRFRDDAARRRFFAEALDAVRAVPGIAAAGFTSQLPLEGIGDGYGVSLESTPDTVDGAFRYSVTGDYFAAMGIPLRRGRVLDDHDAQGDPVVVVNESFARRKFPGGDAIGKRLRFGYDPRFRTIVGVVADVTQTSLAASLPDAVYVPVAQWAWTDRALFLAVRSKTAPSLLAPAIRQAIWSIDKNQVIVRIATMEDLLSASASQRRFALVLFEAFAAVALVLAAMGIYGVLAGSVAERTREIGIRAALGASPGGILALVVRQGLALTGIGVAAGLAGAVAASQAIAGLLFGVSRLDPLTYAGMVALLFAVAAVACWIPAWRAARVDPALTLRAE